MIELIRNDMRERRGRAKWLGFGRSYLKVAGWSEERYRIDRCPGVIGVREVFFLMSFLIRHSYNTERELIFILRFLS